MPRKKHFVLIVDDETDLAFSLAEGLSLLNENIDTKAVQDGNQALEFLANNKIDLMITDIMMPGISGIDLLIKARQEYPKLKVIIITAYGSKELFQQAIKGGAIYYLEKPFDLDYLNNLILKNLEIKTGFSGKIKQVSITEIIQMLGLSGKKVGLSITKAKYEGIIYFDMGKIIHAETGTTEGMPAFNLLMSSKNGQFTPLPDVDCSKITINERWEKLLLGMLDEIDFEAISPLEGTLYSVTPSLDVISDTTISSKTIDIDPTKITTILDKLLEIPDVVTSAFMDENQQLIGSTDFEKIQLKYLYFAYFAVIVQAQTTQLGNLNSFLMKQSDGQHKIIICTNKGLFLIGLKSLSSFDGILDKIYAIMQA
jgi:CheY-like chemotaxis protein